MNTRRSVVTAGLLAFLIALSACRVDIIVPEGGRVVTESKAYSCDAGKRCSIDVVDIFFDETFEVIPEDGYEFRGWSERHKGLCGGRKDACRLSTAGFAGNDALTAVLESDEVFYLQPSFGKIGLAGGSEKGPQVGFDDLDRALAEKSVATNTANGLWLLYGEGRQRLSMNAGETVIEDRVDLTTAIIRISNRSEFEVPGGFANTIKLDSPAGAQRYSFRVSDILAPFIYVFTAGDDENNISARFDKTIDATLSDNRTLVFETYSEQDSIGSTTGSFRVKFKARKISEDNVSPIGTLSVNDREYAMRFYSYNNYFSTMFVKNDYLPERLSETAYTGFVFAGWDASGDLFASAEYTHQDTVIESGSGSTPSSGSGFRLFAEVLGDGVDSVEEKAVAVDSELAGDTFDVDFSMAIDLAVDFDFDVREVNGAESFAGSISTDLFR